MLQVAAGVPILLWWRQADTFRQVSAGTLYPVTMVQLLLEDWWAAVLRRPWIAVLAVVVAIITVLALTRIWKGWLRRAGAATEARPLRLAPAVRETVIAWGIVALFTFSTVLSVVPRLYTLKRLTVPLLPYALAAMAWALTSLSLRRSRLSLVLVASLGMSLLNLWWVPKTPWREAVSSIDARLLTGDIIWIDELAAPVFDYYHNGGQPSRPWRIHDLDALTASPPAAHRLWMVTQANRLRYLFDLYPNLDRTGLVWSGTWPGIEARVYDLTQLDPDALTPQADIPTWMRNLTSPLDEACRAP